MMRKGKKEIYKVRGTVAEHQMPESLQERRLSALMDGCTLRVLIIDGCDNEGKGDKVLEQVQRTGIGSEVDRRFKPILFKPLILTSESLFRLYTYNPMQDLLLHVTIKLTLLLLNCCFQALGSL